MRSTAGCRGGRSPRRRSKVSTSRTSTDHSRYDFRFRRSCVPTRSLSRWRLPIVAPRDLSLLRPIRLLPVEQAEQSSWILNTSEGGTRSMPLNDEAPSR